MKWEKHDKWAKKMGISKDISEYVNKIIDGLGGAASRVSRVRSSGEYEGGRKREQECSWAGY